ncbi:MAG TPA: hypothetical protein DCW47_00125 [Lachnospiraceae bacterium]|nr:hypothetical protein [Lachnospiraceae bacterium]
MCTLFIYEKDKMIMRVKDCSREHDPFAKYEYSTSDDGPENLGIKIVKSFDPYIILFNEA